MSMAMKVREILLKKHMSIKELSVKLGLSKSYMYNKLSRDNFTVQELESVAKALDCDYESFFIIRDTGEKI